MIFPGNRRRPSSGNDGSYFTARRHISVPDAQLKGASAASNTAIAQYNQAVLHAVRDVAAAGSSLQGLEQLLSKKSRQRIETLN